VPFERVEVIGDHATLITEEMNRVSYTLALDTPTRVEEFYHLPQTLSWGVEEEDKLFIDAIVGKQKPPVTVEDGYKAVEIIEACYRSVESRKPISLPL
jgi:myo-inositol 2-dehydrogenase/D-chiro-inositol 1-dehydrogenase